MNDTKTLLRFLSVKLQLTCQATDKNGRDMKELGEILLKVKKEDALTEIPELMIALGDYIITEMKLLANLLNKEVAAIKEKE